jgi:KDO2-lipid IV(A) lauroyltransferase
VPKPRSHLLHPARWPSWLGIGLIRLISLLPHPALMWLGRRIGDLSHALLKQRRHITDVNLQLCFPQLDEATRVTMRRDAFRDAGLGLMDTIFCWWASPARFNPRIRFEGLEHLENARGTGRGLLLLAGHFTTTDLSVRALRLQLPLTAFAADAHDPVVNDVMTRRREYQLDAKLIAKEDVRTLVRTLKKGGAVWYSPDQVAQRATKDVVPFFGQPAMTTLATGRIARMGNAIVLPTQTVRSPDHRGYCVMIFPALDQFPGNDEHADALRVNRVVEDMVRRAPPQYFWLHRRFKRAINYEGAKP